MFLAKSMLQRGSVIVGTDISEEMIKMSKLKFEDADNDFNKIPGNKSFVTASELAPFGSHEWNLENYLANDMKFTD